MALDEHGNEIGGGGGEELSPFMKGLSEENRAHPSAEKFAKSEDNNAIFQSYVEMEQFRGKQGIILPDENNPEDRARFNTEMGVPKTAEEYKMGEVPAWAQEMQYDQNRVKALLHKADIPERYADRLQTAFLEDTLSSVEQQKEARKELLGKQSQELRGQWGPEYDKKSAMADKVAEKFFGARDETGQALAAVRALMEQYPSVKAGFADVGGNFSEHSIGDFTPKALSSSPAEAKEKMDAMRADRKGPYYSTNQGIRQGAIKQMTEWGNIVQSAKR